MRVVFVGLILICGMWAKAQAAILRVPEEFSSIQMAMNSSAAGDTIWVAPGEYTERLITPTRSLTMVSNYFFSHDSLDIENTVIDAEWFGPVITVNAGLNVVFRLEGFTLRRGMGQRINGVHYGGGLHFRPDANVTVRHVVFRENRVLDYAGTIINAEATAGHPGRLYFEDLRFHLYTHPEQQDGWWQIMLAGHAKITARKLRFVGNEDQTWLGTISADTLICDDITIDMTDYPEGSSRTGLGLHAFNHLNADSVYIRGCRRAGRVFTATVETGTLELSNLTMEDCTNDTPYSESTTGSLFSCTADTVTITNWISRRNFSNLNNVVGSVGARSGRIINLLAEDNVSGAPPEFDGTCNLACTGGILRFWNCSLEKAMIRRNTSYLFDSYSPNFDTVGFGGVLSEVFPTVLEDTLYFKNITFSDNIVHDPDDYSNLNLYRTPNTGRAMILVNSGFEFDNVEPVTVMDSCRFSNNRQPNLAPEIMSDPMLVGRMVGSTAEFLYGSHATSRGEFIMRNCEFLHNDDGGLFVDRNKQATIENLIMYDNARMGIYCKADTINMRNVLIQGTNSCAAYMTYPYNEWVPSYQCVLGLRGGGFGEISNLSLIDNHTEFLFWNNWNTYSSYHVSNSIMWGNTYDYFTNPVDDIASWPPPTVVSRNLCKSG